MLLTHPTSDNMDTILAPLPSSPVDQAPEYCEEFREAVYLIQDHQLVLVRFQIELGIGELVAVGRGFSPAYLTGDCRPGGIRSRARATVSEIRS